jgi:hypothetical protein
MNYTISVQYSEGHFAGKQFSTVDNKISINRDVSINKSVTTVIFTPNEASQEIMEDLLMKSEQIEMIYIVMEYATNFKLIPLIIYKRETDSTIEFVVSGEEIYEY